jgi:hypothetical protein
LNDFRKGYVKRAFKKLDKDANGSLELDDIKGVYNAKNHPDVKAGKRTEDDVLLEFLETFETHHNVLLGKEKDYKVTPDEFEEYYANISMSIDGDEYFALMMKNAWKLDEADRTYAKGWKGEEETKAPKGSPPKFSSPVKKGAQTNMSSAENTLIAQPEKKTKEHGRPATAKDKESSQPSSSDQALEAFRKKLAGRGTRGIIGIARQFKVRYAHS